jgi:hypothetical protein
MWKVERVPERGNTVKEISSQDVGNYFWFLFPVAYIKIFKKPVTEGKTI